MMNHTRQTLQRDARALGIAIDFRKDSGRSVAGTVHHEIVLTAPARARFSATDTHEIVCASHVDGAPMETLYASVAADIAAGLTPCTDDDCEWCSEG